MSEQTHEPRREEPPGVKETGDTTPTCPALLDPASRGRDEDAPTPSLSTVAGVDDKLSGQPGHSSVEG